MDDGVLTTFWRVDIAICVLKQMSDPQSEQISDRSLLLPFNFFICDINDFKNNCIPETMQQIVTTIHILQFI